MTYTFEDILEITKDENINDIINFYLEEKKSINRHYEVINTDGYYSDLEGNINNYFRTAIVDDINYPYFLKDVQIPENDFKLMAPYYLYVYERMLINGKTK